MTVTDGLRWQATDPVRARSLSDARLQLHYAVQFAAGLGISYLEHEPDDGHTNLGWNAELGALVSRSVPGSGAVAIGIRLRDLMVLVMRDGAATDRLPLGGITLSEAHERLGGALGRAGLDRGRYTLERHYELPAHPVATGGAFGTDDVAAFDQLARWFANAAIALGRVAGEVRGASEVRVWPHHFDIATLVSYGGGASTGAGLEPGDGYYDEPYFYVNARPQPKAERLSARLAGHGRWHTKDWIGAVLRGSDVTGDGAAQERQVSAFLASALEACRGLVGA